TFTGGIANFGVISGSAGIEIKTAHPVSIFAAGTIVGTGGTAIPFAASGNTLTLAAGYTISGTAEPSGHNSFALGGTGSGTFDLSLIGTQFNGFTTFDVVGGTWTVNRASGWNVNGGVMDVASGTSVSRTTVSGGGVLLVESGGFVSSATVKAGGTELFEPGGTMSRVTISKGATLELAGSTVIPPGVTLAQYVTFSAFNTVISS